MQSHWVCLHRTEVPQKLIHLGDCLVVSLLGFLEHLLGMLNLQLAGLHVIIQQDGSPGPSSLQEILQGSSQLVNSLGQLPALCVESLLLDDGNNVRKVFLSVPSGEDGHIKDGPIGKFHLQSIWRFLDSDKIRWWDVRDGWPTAQLPFLALGILQSFESLEGGAYFGVLPECGTSTSLLNVDLSGTCRNHTACIVA